MLVPGVKTVLIEKEWSPKQVASRIKQTAGVPLKLALECTGVQSSIHSAVYVSCYSFIQWEWVLTTLAWQSMQFGGKVFIIGVGQSEQLVCHFNYQGICQ